MRNLIIVLFFLMIVVQWFIPLGMIIGQEKVLSNGKVFKFKTQPIDPSDPFRGKYIVLRFAETTIEVDTSMHLLPEEEVFVEVVEGEDGFAKTKSVAREQPDHTEYYFKARVGYPLSNTLIDIEYPFDRFYLEESKASEAERAYWEATSDSTQIVYALVAVKNGKAALKDVMINDQSIVDIVKVLNEK